MRKPVFRKRHSQIITTYIVLLLLGAPPASSHETSVQLSGCDRKERRARRLAADRETRERERDGVSELREVELAEAYTV